MPKRKQYETKYVATKKIKVVKSTKKVHNCTFKKFERYLVNFEKENDKLLDKLSEFKLSDYDRFKNIKDDIQLSKDNNSFIFCIDKDLKPKCYDLSLNENIAKFQFNLDKETEPFYLPKTLQQKSFQILHLEILDKSYTFLKLKIQIILILFFMTKMVNLLMSLKHLVVLLK